MVWIRQGGHGKRRILHADDLTGWAIEKALLDQIAKNRRLVAIRRGLLSNSITEGKLLQRWRKPGRCMGAYVLDSRSEGKILTLSADITVLATGGAGKVYLYTSNPDTATGTASPWPIVRGRAWPIWSSCSFIPDLPLSSCCSKFFDLRSITWRGCRTQNSGRRRIHEMPPRIWVRWRREYVVARAIDMELKRSGDKHVWLDCTHLSRAEIERKFPNIDQICLKYGIDMATQPIPVVPAMHYTCGGVLVDRDGLTSIDGLYAIGEVSCTGLHGANRLASNSLLEAVVLPSSFQACTRKIKKSQCHARDPVAEWDSGRAVPIEEQIETSPPTGSKSET